MFYRNSSAASHLGGALVIASESSHGVMIDGGSTGGTIVAVGDDTDISLTVKGKGAGKTTIGTGTPMTGIFQYVVEYTPPAVEASSFTALSTITVTGLTTNATLIFTPRTDVATPSPSTGGRILLVPFCSTAGELKLVAYNQTGSTISAQSTTRGILTEIRF